MFDNSGNELLFVLVVPVSLTEPAARVVRSVVWCSLFPEYGFAQGISSVNERVIRMSSTSLFVRKQSQR